MSRLSNLGGLATGAMASLLMLWLKPAYAKALNAEQPAETNPGWVTSWQASPQPVWGEEFIFPTNVPKALNNQTITQYARVSLGGDKLRLVFANTYGDRPVTLGQVSVRVASPAPGLAAAVTFNQHGRGVIPPGGQLVSDAIELPVQNLAQLEVKTYLAETTPVQSFHWDGRQTSWITEGNSSALPDRSAAAEEQSTTARLLLSDIWVQPRQPATGVVVIGDSITDGATASLDNNSRWPDFLAERLVPHNIAVANAGISGARLLSDGMGESALARLERDVLSQPGVSSVIVLLGINDISWPGTAFAPNASLPSLKALTTGFEKLVARAHRRGVTVIGATLPPFQGALPDTPLSNYYQADKNRLRQQLNQWIKTSGSFDAVVDLDTALQDPTAPLRLLPKYDSGDHLHPGDAGNRAMAQSVDLQQLLALVGPNNLRANDASRRVGIPDSGRSILASPSQ
ncbi:SGNH/GDSL hydrolase family protein [Halioxenophilus aromaticivorans]|uniref:SGNH/GDSL hydrolase family protein n=1 Tax=Halioxenophilus aromaticivorans TaxID=1306992 RepID=A0AAV3U3C5_9ALTE